MGNQQTGGGSGVPSQRERHKCVDGINPVANQQCGAPTTAAAFSSNSNSAAVKTSHTFLFDKKSAQVNKARDSSSFHSDPSYFTANSKGPSSFPPPPMLDVDQRRSLRPNSVSGEMSPSPLLSDNTTPTVFRWEGGGRDVYIGGSFNDWKVIPMVRSHCDFVTIVDLPEGEHQYKFYVDGEWRTDPTNKTVDSAEMSTTRNNLITVKRSDFEVFQALDKDSEGEGAGGGGGSNGGGADSIEKEFSQEVHVTKPWEKVTGPPILPPHLLQVILNKDTPLSCEPTLLPEPNHVMLNHLYALSIKDGVMVLSATHRYRKKYVTTLLYKPI